MPWSYTKEVATTATAERIWALWTDVANWSAFDKQVNSSTLETLFAPGGTIILKSNGGPAMRCVLTEVTPLRSFTTTVRFCRTDIAFLHHFAGGVLCHGVEIRGLLAPLLSFCCGWIFKKGLDESLDMLKAKAEQAPSA